MILTKSFYLSFLKYLFETVFIYLMLIYLPFTKLSPINALKTSLIIVIFIFIIEFIFDNLKSKDFFTSINKSLCYNCY